MLDQLDTVLMVGKTYEKDFHFHLGFSKQIESLLLGQDAPPMRFNLIANRLFVLDVEFQWCVFDQKGFPDSADGELQVVCGTTMKTLTC